jgi:hypothetical protein
MAAPTSRSEFKDFVMRKIGAPVIQINVADEQVEDRIDEAVSFWNDYHYNGSEHVYLKHQLTQENIDGGYIDVPENIIGAPRVWDLGSSLSAGTGMFNVTYQFVLNNVHTFAGGGLQDYYMSMQNIQFMKEILVGTPLIRYNRHVNRLQLDHNMKTLEVGRFIIIEAYAVIDGEEIYRMWNDRWLQNYASALIREQWGRNLTKFIGMQLVGGVQFNGEAILSEALIERQKMEEEAIGSLQPLTYGFIG